MKLTRFSGTPLKMTMRIGIAALATVTALVALPYRHALGSTAQTYGSFRLPASQYDRLVSADYGRCLDSSGGVTIEMRDCAAAEIDRLDVRLNAAYRAAVARIPDRRAQARLRDLERRWRATRWDECRRETDSDTGTLGLLMLDACGISEMARRVLWLEQYGR